MFVGVISNAGQAAPLWKETVFCPFKAEFGMGSTRLHATCDFHTICTHGHTSWVYPTEWHRLHVLSVLSGWYC